MIEYYAVLVPLWFYRLWPWNKKRIVIPIEQMVSQAISQLTREMEKDLAEEIWKS